MDWKLQNNHERRSIFRKKQFYRILLVVNIAKLSYEREKKQGDWQQTDKVL